MVKAGNFTVELVEAKKKVPYCEYSAKATNGTEQSLVFLDQGDEYYVRVKSDVREKIMCSVIVDGENLGYTVKLGSRPSDCGLWSFKSGRSINRSLKYKGQPSSSSSTHHSQEAHIQCKWIDVEFYEAVRVGTELRTDHLPSYTKEASYKEGREVVYKEKSGKTRTRHEKGKLLQRVSLGYCSILEAPELCYNAFSNDLLQ